MTLFSWFAHKNHANKTLNEISEENNSRQSFHNCSMWPTAKIKSDVELSIQPIPRKVVRKSTASHTPVAKVVLNTKKV